MLERQDPLQSRYTGGTVLHCYLGEKMPSVEATKTLVRTIAENFHLPYYSLTPTFSICEQHWYLAGEQQECPRCGSPCEVWSRSVGYLRPVDQWNPGKQVEFKHRRTYDRLHLADVNFAADAVPAGVADSLAAEFAIGGNLPLETVVRGEEGAVIPLASVLLTRLPASS